MADLELGAIGEADLTVTRELTTKHTGESRMFCTAALVDLMEDSCINGTQRFLPVNHTTLGYEINLKHLAPTPLGQRVSARSELVAIDGRKLEFRINAYCEDKKIGEATHRRVIVDLTRFNITGRG